jgi:hypothetical protein
MPQANEQEYLALYTGPCRPISATFSAPRFHGWPVGNPVVKHIASHYDSWYAEGRDVLDLNAASATLEADTEAALIAGNWTLLHDAPDTGDFAVYAKTYA